jgi:hypothetical protein
MPKLTGKQKNWLVSAHVALGGLWFGTAICMVAIALNYQTSASGDELYAANAILKLLDDLVIIPAAMLSLLTGGLLSWLTIWGFVKFYWVITKWIATVTLIVMGTFWLGPWTNAATAIAKAERLNALTNPLFMFDIKAAMLGGAIQIFCLLTIIAISVLKPWGRRDSKTLETPNIGS